MATSVLYFLYDIFLIYRLKKLRSFKI